MVAQLLYQEYFMTTFTTGEAPPGGNFSNHFMGHLTTKQRGTPKPNGFADHYPYEKWLFHWEY